MSRKIKNSKQLESGDSIISVRDGSTTGDFIYLDGTTVKMPVNTAWENIVNGEVFIIEYYDEA